jgi:hypothetical protein
MCNRKRRKETLDKKRNKRQSILTEDEMKKNEKSVVRHKRYLILKHKREANRARTNETSNEIVSSSGKQMMDHQEMKQMLQVMGLLIHQIVKQMCQVMSLVNHQAVKQMRQM